MRTIRSSREFDELFREGTRVSHPLVIALIRATPSGRGPEGRVAFVAGKKLGGAVHRNRCKRVLRAAARDAGAPWPGMDVILISRPDTAQARAGQLKDALSSIARRLEGPGGRR